MVDNSYGCERGIPKTRSAQSKFLKDTQLMKSTFTHYPLKLSGRPVHFKQPGSQVHLAAALPKRRIA